MRLFLESTLLIIRINIKSLMNKLYADKLIKTGIAVMLFLSLILPTITYANNKLQGIFPENIAKSHNQYSDNFDDNIQSYLYAGVDSMMVQNYFCAYDLLILAEQFAQEQDSNSLQVLALNNLGNLFYYMNSMDSALLYYYKALDIAEEHELFNIQNTLNNNIGIIYSKSEQYKEADSYFEQALAVSILLKDSFKIALNFVNSGLLKLKENDLYEAKYLFTKSIKYFNALPEHSNIKTAYTGLGDLYFAKEEYDNSLYYYRKAFNLIESSKQSIDNASYMLNMGKIYFAVDEADSSLHCLDSAYALSMLANQFDVASSALEWKIKVYKKTGDFPKAVKVAESALLLKDSVIIIEKRREIERGRIKYDFSLKEFEFTQLEKATELRKFFWRLIFLILVILVILLIVIMRLRLKSSKIKREKSQLESKVAIQKLDEEQHKNKELADQIESVNYELMSKSLLIDNKNEVIKNISVLIKQAGGELSDSDYLREMKQHLQSDQHLNKNMEEFSLYFERVHTDFFIQLHKKHSDLSSNDLRLAAFIILQFNSSEIANLLHISAGSVRKRKQRLREKLGLDAGSKLLKYLYTFTK